MFDITILSIMRNSMDYMERYIGQVNSVFDHFERCHLIITEGDSTDGTKEYLAKLAKHNDSTIRGDVTIVTLDQNNEQLGNINHPSRWFALETAWNTNLQQLEPTHYAICVESDLIWNWDTVKELIGDLSDNVGDVVLPMLMRDTPTTGKYFYDVNAYRLDGQNLANFKPYHAKWDDTRRFMRLDTGGGLLVTTGKVLKKAKWKNKCVLHYAPKTKVVVDTQLEIFHP